MGLEVLFYPLSYHAHLQRLGLKPARPLLPHWKSFVPFSPWSSLIPLSVHHDASVSAASCLKAILTSPLVMIIAEHFYERWVYSAIFEAVEAFIIRPDNADIESPDAVSKDRATSILGLQRRSPPMVRTAIKKMLVFLGWCEPDELSETDRKPSLDSVTSAGQSVEVAGSQLLDLAPVDIPVSRTDRPATDGANDSTVTIPVEVVDDLLRPATPPTPTTSDHDDNDPRIRITSREGIVEMEVRLPPRIISSHTEILDGQPAAANHSHVTPRRVSHHAGTRPRHRVTQLSTEPSQMIGAIVKAQLIGLAVLPFKLVVLRLVANHYLASHQNDTLAPRFVEPIPSLSTLTAGSIATGISRVALCAGCELAIDLSLWSVQCLAVTSIGKSTFGWGAL